MHYFIKVDSEIHLASCEKDAGVEPALAQGYFECDHASFSAAWAARDRQRLEELEPIQERAVGEVVEPTPIDRNVVYPSNWKH